VNEACTDGKCEDIYTGALCAECIEGYGQNGFNVCAKCASGSVNVVLAVLLIIVLIIVCGVLTYLSLRANPAEPNVGASVFKVQSLCVCSVVLAYVREICHVEI